MSQFTHGYALLIGVGQCQYSPYSLPVTVKDVEALRDTFTDANLCAYPANDDHIRLLTNEQATRQGILEALKWLADQCQKDGDATAIVHFSGHGMHHKPTDRFYLVTHDIKPVRPAETALLADDFKEALSAIRAKRLLVFMDCCHASAMGSTRHLKWDEEGPADFDASALPQSLATTLKQGEGRAVFSSSKDDQPSWNLPDMSQGLFTKYLLEALQGAGNRPGETEVTVSSIMGHISRNVAKSAKELFKAEQTPYFETATEDFAIALVQGGQGLTRGQLEELVGNPPDSPAPTATPYQISNSGSGAVAVGDGSVAAGERGVAIGGNVSGSTIMTGNDNRVDNSSSVFNQSGQTVRGSQTNIDGDVNTGGGLFNTGRIDTGGGAFVGRDVRTGGDFVGRDKVVHGDNVHGDNVHGDKIGGDKVDGDKISIGDITDSSNIAIGHNNRQVFTSSSGIDPAQLNELFAPLLAAAVTASPNQFEAVQTVTELKAEVAKGDKAEDKKIAKLIEGFIGLVPAGVGAIVGAFASPILGAVAGPATEYVIEKIQG